MGRAQRVSVAEGVTVLGAGSEHELPAIKIEGRVARVAVQVAAGNPTGCGRHPVLVAEYGSHRVGSMAGAITRSFGTIPGIEPIIIVTNATVLVASVAVQ